MYARLTFVAVGVFAAGAKAAAESNRHEAAATSDCDKAIFTDTLSFYPT
jgi:hypothetical protein